jgi:hypothetical protein
MHFLKDAKVERCEGARVLSMEVELREDEGRVMLLVLGVVVLVMVVVVWMLVVLLLLVNLVVERRGGRRFSLGGRRRDRAGRGRGQGIEGGSSIVLHFSISFCPFSLL